MASRFEIIVRAQDGVSEEQVAAVAEGFANGLEDGWDVALRPVEDSGLDGDELAKIAGGTSGECDVVIRPRGARRK